MPGEKNVNRPAGATESDFDTLSDWTITDIANTEKAAPEDRQNAEAEIARRESEGIYDPDSASHDVRQDLLSHGYGVENGKVLYPKSEYNAWLQSDRSTPAPTGVNKETLQDRLDTEKEIGSAALGSYSEYEDKLPIREKISHQERIVPGNKKISMDRKAEKKARDIELNERRKLKEINKYDNNYSNTKKERISQASANLPIVEEQLVVGEDVHKTESLNFRAEKIYNAYSELFPKNAPKWLAYGVSSAIERGTFNSLSTGSLITSGFWSHEQDKIHDKLDPEDIMSAETIDAESNLKIHIARDLIGEKINDLSKVEIERAKLKGSLYSIYSGARIDEKSRRVVYAIPPEKGDEVREFMEQSGINFEQFGEKARARTLSYQGFANIIEAIKGDDKETERGFKALDWYFDNFAYGEQGKDGEKGKIDAFLGNLGFYEETADDAWRTKYNEYLDCRKEIDAFYNSQKNPPLFERKNVQEDVSIEKLKEKLLAAAEGGENRILLKTSIGRGGRHGGPRASFEDVTDDAEKDQYVYIDTKKLGAIISKYEEYQRFDPNIKLHTVFWTDEHTGKETHYAVLDYTVNSRKVAIIAPYENKSSDAAFDVVDADWEDVFIASPESKLSVREREGVKALNHRANIKQGRDGIQNMWFNHEKYVDEAIKNTVTT